MEKGYKRLTTQVRLTDEQQEAIDDMIRLQRTMWNKLVEVYNPIISVDMRLEKQREMELFLKEAFKEWYESSHSSLRVIRGAIILYLKAWKRAFSGISRKPKFHSCFKSRQSVYLPDVKTKVKADDFSFSLSVKNTSPIKGKRAKFYFCDSKEKLNLFFENRLTEFKTKECTYTVRNGRYYISVCFEYKILRKNSLPGEIGLDWGLKDYFIDNNGNTYNLPQSVIRQQVRISKLHCILSNKVKGSKNFVKVVKKLNNAYLRQKNIKKDWIEKFTHELCSNNQLVVIETLDLREMRKTSHRKRRYYMNINSFYNFRRSIEMKSVRFQTNLVAVPQYFPSSQICSKCGHSDGKKPLSQRTVKCSKCGNDMDRDVNAAINILQEGRKILSAKPVG